MKVRRLVGSVMMWSRRGRYRCHCRLAPNRTSSFVAGFARIQRWWSEFLRIQLRERIMFAQAALIGQGFQLFPSLECRCQLLRELLQILLLASYFVRWSTV